jgi:hypothetical protein
MKTPHLLASFAVATMASAADLKDPAEVAREWKENAALPPVFSTGLDLATATTLPAPRARNQLPSSVPPLQEKSASSAQVPSWGKSQPRSRGKESSSEGNDHEGKMPPGAKEWKYGGQTYWLLPLIPSRDT